MLSSEDKKAYLTILSKRRKVRHFLKKAQNELSAEMARADEHREAAKKSMAEIIDLTQTHYVPLSDYRALLDIHNDIIDKVSKSVTHQNEIHGFIDGIKKKIKLFDHVSNEMKLQLKRHFKGRGKVLRFERHRS
jgi:replicative DNA helicase